MTTIRKVFNVLILGLVLCWVIPMMISHASGEEAAEPIPEGETEEAGFSEIMGILEAHPVEDMEGMDLEALTEALTESTMGEFFDPTSGFRMQYPSMLQFTDEDGAAALSEDGKIRLTIISTPDGKDLTDEILMEAVKMEDPSGEIRVYEEPDCLAKETITEENCQIDIYMISGGWLHHVTLVYPEDQKESIVPFIEYMINSMTTEDGDVG